MDEIGRFQMRSGLRRVPSVGGGGVENSPGPRKLPCLWPMGDKRAVHRGRCHRQRPDRIRRALWIATYAGSVWAVAPELLPVTVALLVLATRPVS
jgi:hypothetical protein